MKRIYDFSSFSSLYEAEGEKKISDFQNLIQMSVANILSCYKNQTLITKEKWLKLIPDYDSVIADPGVDSFKKILDGVKSSAADDAKDTGEAWAKAGNSFIAVLSKIYELMPNNKDAINRIISDYIKNTSKPNLKSATEDNPAKEAADKAEKEAQEKAKADNNSEQFESGEELYESLDFLKGKKGRLSDISKQINGSATTLADLKAIDFLKDEAEKQEKRLGEISKEIGVMFGRKNRDIKEEDIVKYEKEVPEIISKLEDKQKELASQNETAKEAALLFTKATEDLTAATEKNSEYVAKKATEEDEKKKDSEVEEKIKKSKGDMNFKGTIKKDEVKGKKSDQVAEFQRLIRTKFEKKIKDSEEFKKFTKGKYAGDGYFGNNTEKVIKALKAGLGMKDGSSDITEELIDKVLSLKESRGFEFGRLKSFESFGEINEKVYKDVKFDVDKFLEVADGKKRDLPTPGDLLKSMNKTVEDVYNNNKDGIDYILGKDFQPTEEGRKNFVNIFRIGWDNFSKLNDNQKKNTIAMGFKSTLAPAIGVEKGIDKDLVNVYLKAEKKA
jgi:hypothetical protein